MTAPTLHLHLKAEYFDAIVARQKKEEYRLVSKWKSRLKPTYAKIILYRGYPKKDEWQKRLECPWDGYEIKTLTHPHFGPEPVEVYAIRVNP